MRTTIDIPDTLYRAVRTRTAAEHVASDKADTAIKPNIPFFGMLKPRMHADGPHDMESIRASIANGRASEHAGKRKRGARK